MIPNFEINMDRLMEVLSDIFSKQFGVEVKMTARRKEPEEE